MDFEEQVSKLDAVKMEAGADEARLGDSLVALGARKREMEDAMTAFLASRHATPGEDAAADTRHGTERRVHRAEQAFDRAMSGAGGLGFSRADADTVSRVAEIEVMQKRSTVAARLDALKQAAAV